MRERRGVTERERVRMTEKGGEGRREWGGRSE